MVHAHVRPAASEPLFLPLGVSQHRSETWYHIRVGKDVRVYRPTQAIGLGFLLGLLPDAEHWRRSFPTELHGRKIDTQSACAAIQRMCIAAGEYRPEPIDDPPAES